MTDDQDKQRERDIASARDAVRRLPRATPSEAARERARAAFLNGETAARSGERRPGRVRDRGRRRGLVALLAASILGMVGLWRYGAQPQGSWSVVDATGGSTLVAGAVQAPGALSTGPGEEVELLLGSELRLRLLPETTVNLPAAPGRWFNRSRSITVASGEVFGTSGGHPTGFPLSFVTGELTAHLTGTTFAVFRTDEASCVCLWEGAITVAPSAAGHGNISLEPEQRVWVFKDDRTPETMPLSDMEIMKLQMMSDAGVPTKP